MRRRGILHPALAALDDGVEAAVARDPGPLAVELIRGGIVGKV